MVSFEGIRIWASVTVPGSVRQKIRDHGGELVKLERDAQICLTDHRRNPTFSGAFSYTWIEDCIAANAQLDEERYKVPEMLKRDVEEGRTTFAQHNARHKRVRTEFTNDDDNKLIEWVLECHANDRSLTGNKMYQEFEERYPHHTWQSWRERWRRKLQAVVIIPRRTTSTPFASSNTAPQAGQSGTASNASLEQARPTQANPASSPAQSQLPRRVDRPSDPGNPLGISNEEFLILAAINKAKQQGEVGRVPGLFQSLHDKNPNLSVQEWEQRYDALRARLDRSETRQNQKLVDADEEAHDKRERHEERERQEEREEQEEQEDVPYVPPPEDPIELQEHTTHDATVGKHAASSHSQGVQAETTEPSLSDMSILNVMTNQDGKEAEFLRDLELFSERHALFVPTSFYIAGVHLETWALWLVVQEMFPDPDTRDWLSVARSLDLDTEKYSNVGVNLERWYKTNLSEFEKAISMFQDIEDDDLDEEDDIVEDGNHEKQEGREPDEEGEGELGSAPEEDGSQDEQGQEQSQQEPQPTAVTPGRKLFGSVKRLFGDAFSSSGSAAHTEPTTPTRPSKHVRIRTTDENDDKTGQVYDDSEQGHSSHATRQNLPQDPEPETQDFQFDPDTQAPLARIANLPNRTDTTPSQQLHTEERVVRVNPLSLPVSRTVDRVSGKLTVTQTTASSIRRSLPPSFANDHRRNNLNRATAEPS